MDIEDEEETPCVRDNWVEAINEGCKIALFNGPLLSFPVSNLIITLRYYIKFIKINIINNNNINNLNFYIKSLIF